MQCPGPAKDKCYILNTRLSGMGIKLNQDLIYNTCKLTNYRGITDCCLYRTILVITDV